MGLDRGSRTLRRFGCLATSLAASCAMAADYSFQPSVAVRTEYNDNIQLSPDFRRNVWGVIVSPDAKFSAATERLDVVGGVSLGVVRYFNEPSLDTVNHALTLRSGYRTERGRLALDLDSVKDPTLVSELEETGTVLAYRQRRLWSARPSWTWSYDERTAFIASYSYRDVNYEEGPGSGLVDYRSQLGSIAVQRSLSEWQVVTAAVYYDYYKTHPVNSEAETYGFQIGYRHAFSETLRGELVAGWRTTQSTVASNALVCNGFILLGACFGEVVELTSVAKDRSSGYTLDASIEKRTQTDTVTGRLSRQINPSGVGLLVQTDRVGMTWARQWSPTVNSSVDAAAYQARYIGEFGGSNSDNRYYRIESRLDWRLSDVWTMTGGYRYSHQKYESTPLTATGNLVYVTLAYVWPTYSVSR
jgi:uncharacterized protein (PEP-CTERM system associated)